MSLLDRFRRPSEPDKSRYSLNELIADLAGDAGFMLGGMPGGLVQTWGTSEAEPIANSFTQYASAMKGNGPIFAVAEARKSSFSEVRFQWQQVLGNKNLFGNQDLQILETPWVNGTTGDLLARMEQCDTLAGNAYVVRRGDRLVVLRPDWVEIIVNAPNGDPNDVDAEVQGYMYFPGGRRSGATPVTFLPEMVAHYAPTPDPEARYRGMSWLTPVVREVQADNLTTRHKISFFEHAATPNIAVSLDKAITTEQFREFVDTMNLSHKGVKDAYKTLFLAGGADVTVLGSNLKDLDMRAIQAGGETRICAAGNVPPIVASLGPDPTFLNFEAARRKFADTFLRPHWRQAAGALQTIVKPPTGARLWYDAADVSLLQEDEKDAADIASQQATTIRTLVDSGYTPDSAVLAVTNSDMSQLVHSGLYSVQLQAAGAQAPQPPA